jgi:hypothetical protein
LPLSCSPATLATDFDACVGFRCWSGDPDAHWAREVEENVRVIALRYSEHCLAFREEEGGDLVAFSAFGRREVHIPLLGGAPEPCWHMDVAAVSLDRQRAGLSQEVFDGTFAAMRELDSDLTFVTAWVHERNDASIKACAAVGLDFYYMAHGPYACLLKEMP